MFETMKMMRRMFFQPSESSLDLHLYWRRLKAFLKTLSLQRQMMENLIIAQARQDALHRKMEERRLRLQEEASRRLAAVGMITPEEQEQRVLYASVLEYEQDHDWPKMWKASLKRNPNDSTLVSGLVSYLLSCPDHPVVQLLKTLQYNIYDRLYPLVSQCPPITAPSQLAIKTSVSAQNLRSESGLPASPPSYHDHNANREGEPVLPDRENSFEDLEQFMTQMDLEPGCERRPEVVSHIQELEGLVLREPLKNIVKDVHAAIDRLLSLCLLSFECLNTAASKDLCVACIEEAFFPPLWGPLLVLFRKVHRERELSFEMSVRLYRNTTPAEVGVAPKLFPREPSALRASYPYESAVQELRLLSRDLCPQRKLECIVRTLRLICACAEEYRSLQEPDAPPSTAAIGADDLLPILSYVALRTEMPQLVSECAVLEEFIHEGYVSRRPSALSKPAVCIAPPPKRQRSSRRCQNRRTTSCDLHLFAVPDPCRSAWPAPPTPAAAFPRVRPSNRTPDVSVSRELAW
uniref:VPS9 domain containing 1 n=1 Tax=Paramormyrops kingsleyae TaxID=1676925 RepID=A0A3B3RLQ1_9TELE|nr:VPS9 domain-containing protein 1 isoform X2 [Paramormyrops kingsleyae]